jgi:ABC-2 type transport system permease protein
MITGLVGALLGGCWYPLEMFSQTVQNVVKILPTTWAMRGQGLMAILPDAGIRLGFAVVFFGIGIWRFKYE